MTPVERSSELQTRLGTKVKSRCSETKLIRAAIVGTGYIADFHARAIRNTRGVELVGVCDANLNSAQAFVDTWHVPLAFNSIEKMLREQNVHVLHVLTPPNSHHSLAKNALGSGTHVFLEKPMCLSSEEADELLTLAHQKGLHVGVNHNFLFSSAYLRLRDVVHLGRLGPLDHVILNHFFELEQVRYGPFDAWMLRESGNVILEIGPHLVSAMLDLIGAPSEISVIADRQISVTGGTNVYRRWRIRATAGRTAIDININLGPGFNQRNIYVRGVLGAATVDFDANTCAVDMCTPSSIDIDRYRRTRSLARQLKNQARATFAEYAVARLGLRRSGNPYEVSILNSVAAFYSALATRQTLDKRIGGDLGREVVNWCKKIIKAGNIEEAAAPLPSRRKATGAPPTVLVLGGSGFIGKELIRQLLAAGYGVRAMARRSDAVLADVGNDRLEIVRGDLRTRSDVEAALQGIEFVYHLAHADAKTWDDYVRNEVEPTRAVGEACLAAGVQRLIYTGTIASYYAGVRAGTITEQTEFDHNMTRRSYYARAKAKSECVLTEMHRAQCLPVVIFRPGIVIGRGGNPFHWGVGRFSGNICEVWGDGKNALPFVLVGDVASALLEGIRVPNIEGRSYNLVDIPLLTARQYLSELQDLAGVPLDVRHRPIWQFYLLDLAKWGVKVAVHHPDRIRVPSYRDWESRTHKANFDCQRARAELGWAPASDRERMINEGIGGSLQSWLAACR